MAGRGPAPTPKKLLALRGAWRGSGPPTVDLASAVPTPPSWLSVKARAVWDEVVPQLCGAGVLAAVDWSCVAQFCATWVHWCEAVTRVDVEGVMVANDGRGPAFVANPAVRIAAALSVELRQLGDRLGLSPSARARLKAPESAPGGGWADDEPRASTGGA